GKVFARPSTLSVDGVELYVSGADGHLYSHLDWRPWDSGPWRKVETSGFMLQEGADCEIAGDLLFVLDTNKALWAAQVNRSILQVSPSWERVSFEGLLLSRFTVACEADPCQVVATAVDGSVWVANYSPGKTADWIRLHQPDGFRISADTRPGWAIPDSGHLDLFAVGLDGKTYTNTWNQSAGWNV